MKTTIRLKPEFVMTKQEIEQYNALPHNMPDIELTASQIEFVSALYHKYITKIDKTDWSAAMVDIEMKEKWPSGHRMKRHQAQRIVLNALIDENSLNKMTKDEAMKHFFFAMTCRPSYTRLVSKIWAL